ncbi:hypothetical protein CMUST_09635 [Corynebacterium mustelae]|uniref:Uncharacterized protein n=1 Tax=Corynebacterium mustelae TaxID=571915 RepID=A0A0G3H361_9CORY|nr:hypothetical protein [Corynebacterium mustelae]AKK06243.1 hypothetical protein CMUST_09635 [Corynebacterium mustelae]
MKDSTPVLCSTVRVIDTFDDSVTCDDDDALRRLFAGLSDRRNTEDVTRLLVESGVPAHLRAPLYAESFSFFDFPTLPELSSLIDAANRHLRTIPGAPSLTFESYAQLSQDVADTLRFLDMEPDAGFSSRFSRTDLGQRFPELSPPHYRRILRCLIQLGQKIQQAQRTWETERCALMGFAGLAYRVSEEDFLACDKTALFVALFVNRRKQIAHYQYYSLTARLELSTLEQEFLAHALASDDSRPDVLAHVHCGLDVVAQLSDVQLAQMIAVYYAELSFLASRLESLHTNDSNRAAWNVTANAWNVLWFHFLRLLAGAGFDLESSHRFLGMVPPCGIPTEWPVFAHIPKPWEVLRDEKPCSPAITRSVCTDNGVDPTQSLWVPNLSEFAAVSRDHESVVSLLSGINPACATLCTQ